MRELRWPAPARPLFLGLIVVLLGWGAWWWTHPSLLDGTSLLGNGVFAPRPVSRAAVHVSVATGLDRDETIELHSVSARFATNTAKAHASFSICEHRRGIVPIGAVGDDRPLSKYCSRVRPVTDGTTFHLTRNSRGEPDEYILMTITPTAPGSAEVDQVTFDYARTWRHFGQHGSERSEQRWVVRATED